MYTADYYRKLAARMAAIVASNADNDRRARALAYHIAYSNIASLLDNRHLPYKAGYLRGMWSAAIDDGQQPGYEGRFHMARVYWRTLRRIDG